MTMTKKQENVIAYLEGVAIFRRERIVTFISRNGKVGYVNREWPKSLQRDYLARLARGKVVSIVAYGKVRRMFKKGE